MSDAAKDAVLQGIAKFGEIVAKNWPDDSTQPVPGDPGDGDPPPSPGDPGDSPGDPISPDPIDPPPDPDPVPAPPPPTPAPSGKFQVQVGLWRMARWNKEMPLVNYFKTFINVWKVGAPGGAQISPSLIDVNTGYPTDLPSGNKISSVWYFDITDAEGDWVLDVVGDAEVSLGLIGAGSSKNKINAKRTEFVVPKTRVKAHVLIDAIGPGGIQDIRIYRKSDEAALNAGQVWQDRCLGEVGPYDIIRTMDVQNTTSGPFINEASDVATMDYAFWGGTGRPYGKAKQSCPHEALFRLGVESDSQIWMQAPGSLGFPYDWKDPLTAGSDSIPEMLKVAKANYADIMASPEWDKYADDIVAGLEAAGYPESRRLIMSVDNEVWAHHSFAARRLSEYSNGIGQAFTGSPKVWQTREGYGVLIARLMIAMDAALAKAGRNQNVFFAVETQAADDYRVTTTLEIASQYIRRTGGVWSDYAPRMGVSPASYIGSTKAWNAYLAGLGGAAPTLSGLADYLLNGPGNVLATKRWVINKFKAHQAKASKFGVGLLGAYEGGWHLVPVSTMPAGFYRDFVWGDEGARVNIEINKALIAEFPGIVLSNYGTVGDIGGQPWFDGPYGDDNPKRDGWKQILAMR